MTKAGSHGDHWGCFFKSEDGASLGGLIRTALESEPARRSVSSTEVYTLRAGPIGAAVLVSRGAVASAFPVADGGPGWPITVREVIPWAGDIEGQLRGDCHGAPVAFFDTEFLRNSNAYEVGSTYIFTMSAFAYYAGPAPDAEVEIAPGTKVSLAGAHAFMPASEGASSRDTDIDEYWFHSPLSADPTIVRFAGRTFLVCEVTLAIPDHFELSLPLYVGEHVTDLTAIDARPGLDIEGYLWLQGHLTGSKGDGPDSV